jgi:hypothetical protein
MLLRAGEVGTEMECHHLESMRDSENNGITLAKGKL